MCKVFRHLAGFVTAGYHCCRHWLLPPIALIAVTSCELGTDTQAPAATEHDLEDSLFREVSREVGLKFNHFNGMSGALYFIEVTGSGVALFDYDNDGDLDVYVTQGNMLGPKSIEQATFTPKDPLGDRFYRNDLAMTNNRISEMKFSDKTAEAKINSKEYGQGVATGDYDNDGWVDLYVTRSGSNSLFRNLGDGTFSETTLTAGVDDTRWTASAMFFDANRDGWLDLYLCNYVSFTIKAHKTCHHNSGAPDYCGPNSYAPEPDVLFLNNQDGTFSNVSGDAGIAHSYGGCLGVVAADFDGNGWIDVCVANDGTPNQLWMNQGNARFENAANLSGTAVNWEGVSEGSMGVDAADFDNDGDDDLFMTHLVGETNTLYVNDGNGLFTDRTNAAGLGTPSRGFTGFGTSWLDYDNDGWLDLFAANGEVRHIEEQVLAGDPHPLRQKNQLFRNLGNGQFVETSDEAGLALDLEEVSRGVARGDLDNDGDSDLIVTNNAGPLRFLLNEVGNQNH